MTFQDSNERAPHHSEEQNEAGVTPHSIDPNGIESKPGDCIEFLHGLRPDGPWVLCAIPCESGSPNSRTFTVGEEEAMAKWIRSQNNDKRGIYYHVNDVRAGCGKALKSDVLTITHFHVDVDPEKGKPIDAERVRILDMLKTMDLLPKPTAVVYSGGGYQALWKLKVPIEVGGDVSKVEDAERYSRQIEKLLQADACHNADRIMRLAGTVNWPNASKRRNGQEPALARVAWADWDVSYDHTDMALFLKAPTDRGSNRKAAPIKLDAVKSKKRFTAEELDIVLKDVESRARVGITAGFDPDQPLDGANSRSDWVFHTCCAMTRAGVDVSAQYAILRDPDLRISDHIRAQGGEYEQDRAAKRAISNAAQSVADAGAPEVFELSDNVKMLIRDGVDVGRGLDLPGSDKTNDGLLRHAIEALLLSGMDRGAIFGELSNDSNRISDAVKKSPSGRVRAGWENWLSALIIGVLGVHEKQKSADAKIAAAAAWAARLATATGIDEGAADIEKAFSVTLTELGVALEYDVFQNQIAISGLKGFGPTLDDAATRRLRMRHSMCGAQVLLKKDMFDDLCLNDAQYHSRHPVQEYLDGLKWDGVPRIDKFFVEHFGASDTPYVRAVGRIFLVAAVRRVRSPGCKFDELVVLEGDQGYGKSTMLKRLAVRDQWFSDDFPLNADGKKMLEQAAGKWIIECGELKGMRKGDIESLKATLSRTHDRARMAFDRRVTEAPRQWVGIGTTNNTQYLKDQTGNRRFWPIKTGKLDLEGFTPEVISQIWAEAAALESAGESIRLDPELYAAAAEVQAERMVDSPIGEQLEVAVDGLPADVRMPTDDMWLVLGADPAHRPQVMAEQMGAAMRRLGFEKVRGRLSGRLCYYYSRGSSFTDAQGNTTPPPIVRADVTALLGGRVQLKGWLDADGDDVVTYTDEDPPMPF